MFFSTRSDKPDGERVKAMFNAQENEEFNNWKMKVLIIGAVVGAIAGAGAAFLYTQRAEDPYHKPKFSSGDGVRLGLLLLGLVRQVSVLGDEEG
jgi:hypothetical protein